MFKRNVCISDFEKSEKGTKECCLNERETKNENEKRKTPSMDMDRGEGV
jgi:hypothetical protein